MGFSGSALRQTGTEIDVDGCPIERLDQGLVSYVLKLLNNPIDLLNASLVSTSWHTYVLEGSLWKSMCSKLFPELGDFYLSVNGPVKPSSSDSASLPHLKALNCIYQHLMVEFRSPAVSKSCICEPLHASSTDNVPSESIVQTLLSSSVYPVGDLPSYWSSGGQSNTDIPEILTYRLVSDLCVIHEIKIQPFQAYFQPGNPTYSAKSVLFRFGYSRSPWPHWDGLIENLSGRHIKVNDGDYVWTYESPAFSMAQEDALQTFKLPKPVLCIGGIFQVEFMGRVQTQHTDNMYYICISHVNVHGRPLFDFKPEYSDSDNHLVLKYKPSKDLPSSKRNSYSQSVQYPADTYPVWLSLRERLMQKRANLLGLGDRLHFDILLRNLISEGLLTSSDEALMEED